MGTCSGDGTGNASSSVVLVVDATDAILDLSTIGTCFGDVGFLVLCVLHKITKNTSANLQHLDTAQRVAQTSLQFFCLFVQLCCILELLQTLSCSRQQCQSAQIKQIHPQRLTAHRQAFAPQQRRPASDVSKADRRQGTNRVDSFYLLINLIGSEMGCAI